jgi:hypothetical protein
VGLLARPRGRVAVWLPSNVSLLGPLVVILLSLTGQGMRLKAGSGADDLAGVFVDFARATLTDGVLAGYLRDEVVVEHFDRADPRNAEMAAGAKVRIVFGSDEAVAAIEALPHAAGAVLCTFGDHQSEAWIEVARLDDATLTTLIKVFAIYGQAGCTSPRRMVILQGTADDARRARGRLMELWPKVMARDVPMHVASANVLSAQMARMNGWDAELCPRNAAVLACGGEGLGEAQGLMTLALVGATMEEALAGLPKNIQTIGHALGAKPGEDMLRRLADTRVKRFVPLGRMHYFGPIWDGANFFRGLFEEVEIEP